MTSRDMKRYWFPAKTRGWGWGPPKTWEGWVVLVVFILVVSYISIVYPPDRSPYIFPLGIVSSVIVLIIVCWITGEPPSWRWGKKK
jgi:CDP-diglyceride synthetase